MKFSILRGSMTLIAISVLSGFSMFLAAESGNLGNNRITQEQIESGDLSLDEIRRAGMIVFSTPFNRLDGYGDGPMDVTDSLSPGGRPTLQGNGRFLRVNGLDGQTCLECHAIVSAAEIPARLGIGGVGGSAANAMFMPTIVEPADLLDLDGAADFNGRFINPPFVFGAGGVELAGIEMTEELQFLKAQAIASPGTVVPLIAKGVSFGSIVANGGGTLDTSAVVGVDHDLVVRPFGRKGEFASTRGFDVGALQFHFGMQPVEAVGEGVDDDNDGITDEVLIGEVSSIGVFFASLERPQTDESDLAAVEGQATFNSIGCTDCHIPFLDTVGTHVPFRFPEIDDQPRENIYYEVDLTAAPAAFDENGVGGVRVPLFADLKRHDMGDDLAESFDGASAQVNREFTTARLWGVADTEPYLHDGRATTLTDAILMHGGDAESIRDAFAALPKDEQSKVVSFLRTLRTPEDPAADLLEEDDDEDGDHDDERSDFPRDIRSAVDRTDQEVNRSFD